MRWSVVALCRVLILAPRWYSRFGFFPKATKGPSIISLLGARRKRGPLLDTTSLRRLRPSNDRAASSEPPDCGQPAKLQLFPERLFRRLLLVFDCRSIWQGQMADSTTTRFQAGGCGRVGCCRLAGRAFQSRSMTCGLASKMRAILGRVASPCWNVASSKSRETRPASGKINDYYTDAIVKQGTHALQVKFVLQNPKGVADELEGHKRVLPPIAAIAAHQSESRC